MRREFYQPANFKMRRLGSRLSSAPVPPKGVQPHTLRIRGGRLLAKAEQHVDVTPPTFPPIFHGARRRGKGAILKRRAEARTLEEADPS